MANAVKFTPDGGSIDIEVDFVDPDAKDASLPAWLSPDMAASISGPSVVISVSDTGVGIAAEDLQHVFDPFFQTKEGARIKTPSTGLGLSITREIMTMHGGHAWAMSDGPGKGSRFALHLPLVIQEETTGRDADEQECQCDEST
jgi:signal transduction histidine kinase